MLERVSGALRNRNLAQHPDRMGYLLSKVLGLPLISARCPWRAISTPSERLVYPLDDWWEFILGKIT